jgi:hypothetical protein
MYPYQQESYTGPPSQQGASSSAYSQPPQQGGYQPMMGGYDYYGYYPAQGYGYSGNAGSGSGNNSSSVRPLYLLLPFYCLAYMLETACKLNLILFRFEIRLVLFEY